MGRELRGWGATGARARLVSEVELELCAAIFRSKRREGERRKVVVVRQPAVGSAYDLHPLELRQHAHL